MNKHLMASLIKEYGGKKGQDVYWEMVEKAKKGELPASMFPGELGGYEKKTRHGKKKKK